MKNYKENLILIIGMMIILGTHLVSCEKVPTPPVVEPELMPKLELSVTPQGEIPYGGSIDVRWTADQNTNKVVVKVNGVIKATSSGSASRAGALYLGPLFKDLLVSVTATNVDLSTEVGKEVHVGDWTTSTFGLVSYYPWRYKEFRVSSLDGKILVTSPATETEKSWVIYYHKDGRKTFSPNLSSSTYYWDIQNDSTIMYNGTTRKLQVNQEEMIISYEIIFEGEPAWFDMVFEHASDTPTDPD